MVLIKKVRLIMNMVIVFILSLTILLESIIAMGTDNINNDIEDIAVFITKHLPTLLPRMDYITESKVKQKLLDQIIEDPYFKNNMAHLQNQPLRDRLQAYAKNALEEVIYEEIPSLPLTPIQSESILAEEQQINPPTRPTLDLHSIINHLYRHKAFYSWVITNSISCLYDYIAYRTYYCHAQSHHSFYTYLYHRFANIIDITTLKKEHLIALCDCLWLVAALYYDATTSL